MNSSISDGIVWKAVSFTHVEYPKGDVIGLILAWSSLFPVFVLSGFFTHIYFRREIHTITFFVGLLLDECVNLMLKYTIQEPRPESHHTTVNVPFGWPSSHSQFTWFFLTYITYFIHIRFQTNNSLLDMVWKHCMSGLCVIIACIVSYSRYYLLYHTLNQVIWGGLIGFVNASIWFTLTHQVFTPLFSDVVCWPVCEFLLIRDSSLIPNVMWFEYTTSRQESRTRSRKLCNSKLQ